MPPVFRFAPSPNGYLHLGHALSALLNADMARAAGGRLLLRIEDIDEARCRPEYEAAIYEDLAWLGIAWEQPVRRQSEHFDDYRAALASLRRWGSSIALRKPRRDCALVPRRSRALAARSRRRAALSRRRENILAPRSAAPHRRRRALRAAPRHGGGAARVGPLTWTERCGPRRRKRDHRRRPGRLGRRDPGAQGDAHQLSSLRRRRRRGAGRHRVVRGHDLFHSTSVHRLLQALLGLPAPRYHHHRLILDADGNKLSKSTPATGLRGRRAQGVTAAGIRKAVGLD